MTVFTLVPLTADQSVTNSATLTTIPHLAVPVGANQRLLYRYSIYYTTTAAADLKYRVNPSATPAFYRLATEHLASDSSVITASLLAVAADCTALLSSGTEGILRLAGQVTGGNTASQLTFQFAQNTATAAQSAIIRAGSFVEYRYF